MELRPGYKHSDVGVIPSDWDAKPLSSVLSKGRLGGNYANQDAEAELPLMKMGNLARGNFDLSKVQFIRPGVLPDPAHRLVYGDVLFNTRNTLDLVGKVAIWRDEIPVAYYNSNLMRLEFDPGQVCSNEYANYSLNTESAISRLRGLATGTTSVAAIYTRDLLKLQLLVPPLPEQRAIATALSDVDALLATLDQMIAKKRDLKQAAMQQLLTGETRLPGFSGEWVVKWLGDVAEIVMGQSPSSSNYNSTGIGLPLIQGNADIANRWAIKRTYTSQITKRGNARDVLMSVRAPVGEVSRTMFDVCLGRGVCAIRFSNDFLYHTLVFIEPNWVKHSKGSTFDSVNSDDVKTVEIRLPAEETEQIAIATMLSDMDTELSTLEARRDKTRNIKQAMMQELLTGKTRLIENAEIAQQPEKTKANIHFRRSVWAAEIVDQLHMEPTFGHVKFEKILFLSEHICDIDTGSHYLRKAAGPYDNRALRSIDSQIKKRKWFQALKEDGRYRYIPLENRGGHKQYFKRYFEEVAPKLDEVINIFRNWNTEQCEIVATLYSAWNDLLAQGVVVTDEIIVDEVINCWHESKKRIKPERWYKGIQWMRKNELLPKGSIQ